MWVFDRVSGLRLGVIADRPLVNEATQKKIRITKVRLNTLCSLIASIHHPSHLTRLFRGGQAGDETFRAISEFVDPKHIPTDYGGSLTCGDEPDSCRWHSPEETALREVRPRSDSTSPGQDSVWVSGTVALVLSLMYHMVCVCSTCMR